MSNVGKKMNNILADLVRINTSVAIAMGYAEDDSSNHWQTLQESLDRELGDCEDHAAAKFHLLTDAGYEPSLAYVHHGTRPHMVCMCEGYILDNLTDIVAQPQDRRDLSRPAFLLYRDCFECEGESYPVERAAKWCDWLKRSGLYVAA